MHFEQLRLSFGVCVTSVLLMIDEIPVPRAVRIHDAAMRPDRAIIGGGLSCAGAPRREMFIPEKRDFPDGVEFTNRPKPGSAS